MKNSEVLFRKCVSCNQRKLKNFLIRICKSKSSSVEIDTTYKMEGRGAYVCIDNKECIENAIKLNKFARALKTSIPSHIIEKLQKRIKEM